MSGSRPAAALLTRGSDFANNVAAMPSLHAAYPMFILLFFWRRARWPVRALLVSYVLAMAFTLVYAGRALRDRRAGRVGMCRAVYFIGSRILDRLARRKARRAQLATP